MIQRGYIILIAGGILIVIGITLTAVYGSSLAGLILNENVILGDVSINPSASVNRTLQIKNIERPISIALHIESEKDGDKTQQTQQQQASNVGIVEEVINPRGVVVNKNQFNNSNGNYNDNNNNGLFTILRPDVEGEYTLIIANLGSNPVKIGGAFGYLPIIGSNNQLNLQPLSGIIVGVILFSVGIITLIVGAIVTILDRRRRAHFIAK